MPKSNEPIPKMSFKRKGEKISPLFFTTINDRFIIGVYQGSISPYDILIQYRQRTKKGWSNIRTPKHIHWAVDILIKMHSDREKTLEFLNFLLKIWENTKPIKSEEERTRLLNLESLLEIDPEDFKKFEELGKKGEYSIKFLILLARLLMLQEKTNLDTAYMFKNLLEALREGEDIVSIATHRGNK